MIKNKTGVRRSSSAPIVAIVGRANVGKSSLFNAFLGRREAIVAREPGTTRASVTAKASVGEKDFWLVDTAGLKDPDDDFELTIQEQIAEATASANLLIVVVEATVPPTAEDRQVANLALRSQKPLVLAINKIDTASKADLNMWLSLGIKPTYATSTTQKTGIEQLLKAVAQNLPHKRLYQASDRLKIALLGRPNVGKSALFNSLARKQQAIVTERSGTTRDINRAVVRYKGREIELMDTAGIRRSGKIERGVEHFSVLRALAAIEEADIGLLLMEVDELNVQLDQKIAGLIKEAGKGLVLVVSKWDSRQRDMSQDKVTTEIAHHYSFAGWAPLIFTSAVTGQNVAKIFDLILDTAKVRSQKFKTTELNSWLQQVVDKHPPAGLRGVHPKLSYMVQEEDQPLPSFKVFGSNIKLLHWSYKRYLERQFRERWPCAGTPIKFWFIEKNIS